MTTPSAPRPSRGHQPSHRDPTRDGRDGHGQQRLADGGTDVGMDHPAMDHPAVDRAAVKHAAAHPSGLEHPATGHRATSHGGAATATTSWSMAAQATLHCLTGCAIGEVLGMVIGTGLGWHNAATVVLSIALAFVFGYALTMRGVLRTGVGLRAALTIALAADTVSITVMEVIDNTAMLAIPGALDATVTNWLFWASLALSLVLAFVVTTPVNRAMISRGRGHAVVHPMHH